MSMNNAPARRLRQAREQRGFLTAADFAREFGLNPVTYQHHENGHRILNAEIAKHYSQLLNCPAGTILFGERLHSVATVRICGTVGNTGKITPMGQSVKDTDLYPEAEELDAWLVSGNGLQPVFNNGDRVIHERLRPGRYNLADLDNIECVIKTASGDLFVGSMIADPDGTSTVTSYNNFRQAGVHVAAASPVLMVRRHLPAHISNH